MSYDKVIAFLAQNPWVLATCALVTLWPLIRGTFKVYRRLESWVHSKIKPQRHVAGYCATSPSYFIATLLIYALYIALLVVVRSVTQTAIDALLKVDSSPGVEVSRFLMGWININCSLLIGMIIGVVLTLAVEVRQNIEGSEQEK